MYVISFHTLYLALIGFFFFGEYASATKLFMASEEAVKDQVLLTLANVMGLVFIFLGVGLLGPIKLAFITSSRKVISVIASILFFNKKIDVFKCIGIVLVLSGMIAENVGKDKKHHNSNKDKQPVINSKTGANKHKNQKQTEDNPIKRKRK